MVVIPLILLKLVYSYTLPFDNVIAIYTAVATLVMANNLFFLKWDYDHGSVAAIATWGHLLVLLEHLTRPAAILGTTVSILLVMSAALLTLLVIKKSSAPFRDKYSTAWFTK